MDSWLKFFEELNIRVDGNYLPEFDLRIAHTDEMNDETAQEISDRCWSESWLLLVGKPQTKNYHGVGWIWTRYTSPLTNREGNILFEAVWCRFDVRKDGVPCLICKVENEENFTILRSGRIMSVNESKVYKWNSKKLERAV